MRNRIIGLFLSASLIYAITGCATPTETIEPEQTVESMESENEEEKEEEEVHILTHEELSMLYSCKPDVRIEDPDIVEIDQESAVLLMKVSELEHGDGSVEAQANDMVAIYNRISNEDFPDNIRDIVFQEGQFTTVKKKSFSTLVPDVNSHLALAMLESGKIKHNALYFESVNVKDSWMSRHREVAFEFEGHRYYK